jgi:hypothetical protein
MLQAAMLSIQSVVLLSFNPLLIVDSGLTEAFRKFDVFSACFMTVELYRFFQIV